VNFYEHKGATIAVNETGDGPPLLFVHCSSASHKEWRFVASHYQPVRTCLMPDLIGYGKTSGHLDDGGNPIQCTDADVVGFLLDRLDEPADIVAHSYGGVAALEAARSRRQRVRSLFLVEPVAFQVLDERRHAAAHRQAFGISERVAAAEAAGDTRRAARIYMGYWIGLVKWTFSPRYFKQSVLRTVPKVAFEFRYLSQLEAGSRNYRDLTCPVTLVQGSRSTLAAHAVVDELSTQLPNSTREEITGAGHMSPFTHPEAVFELVRAHLERAGRE
jgi:pimeloyl-ACP methyl ester carboxylesterase